jgi:hypothetical protein
MSDERLRRAFEVLEPTLSQRSRVEARVVTAWESRQRSLFTEWLDVLRGRPLVNGAWMLAAMAVLLLTTPIGGLLSAIPRAGTVAFTERVNSRSTSIERLAATLGLRQPVASTVHDVKDLADERTLLVGLLPSHLVSRR